MLTDDERQVIVGKRIYQPGEKLPEGLDPAVDRRHVEAATPRWMASLSFSDGGTEPEPEVDASGSGDDLVPPSGSISDVKFWVDGDLRRAQAALDFELAAGDSARTTLVSWLRDVLNLE